MRVLVSSSHDDVLYNECQCKLMVQLHIVHAAPPEQAKVQLKHRRRLAANACERGKHFEGIADGELPEQSSITVSGQHRVVSTEC